MTQKLISQKFCILVTLELFVETNANQASDELDRLILQASVNRAVRQAVKTAQKEGLALEGVDEKTVVMTLDESWAQTRSVELEFEPEVRP